MQKFIPYKNIQIAFTAQGKGEAIVLLHGFLENSTMWENVIPALEKNYQVITIDLLGHGNTERLGYIHTMEEMAQTVSYVLDHLQIEKASFLGHSMGGYVALAFAELFPLRIKKLLLLNSTPLADSPERVDNRNRAIRLVKQNKDAFISMAITNLFGKESREQLREKINALIKEAQQLPTENIVAAMEGLKTRKDRTHILKIFTGEKIFLAGEEDEIVPLESLQQLAKETNTQLKTFRGGHMTHLEANEELLTFFKID
ncbi:pimeloyl-ACP methyl ester carboxylesterase [Mesonia algae]|uniref:Pimeloyl-ACP methyl ester carboxylesterase n=1 Tax=Mesonia algae TaxID=213248 RepID=A0A2W7I9M4_9FLAO|nr:alpha/beta hydrolase [Mesonia algae]PZW41785.1 pimeloyl-ACP methyl ester carboxylesterase [Mesonia algae]